MAIEWTDEIDARILELRGRGVPWKLIVVEGATRKQVQERYALLTSDKPRPTVRRAKAGPKEDEDGLKRLAAKGKLTPFRLAQAAYYREQGRMADTAGGGVKSCLNIGIGGGAAGQVVGDLPLAAAVDAKRQLFQMRFVALGGQSDLLTVMDGVCIRRQTTIALAGGNRHRALELERLLIIACDLIGAWRFPSAADEVA